MRKRLAVFFGTSAYVGLIPGAPGTYGAILGSIIYYLLGVYTNIDLNILLLFLIVIFTCLGTWSCMVLEDEWGHDPSRIVMDETVGQWITYLFIPFGPINIIIGLILFRFFDILKPLGIRRIDEEMHHPFSVMLDDILAGVYALISLHVINYFVQF